MNNLTQTFDMLTLAAEVQLGPATEGPSTWGRAFYLGDGAQRAITDATFNLLKPRIWNPANLCRLSAEAAGRAIQLANLLDLNQARLAWQELKNKLEVFSLVQNLPSILKLTPGEFVPLSELLQKAISLPAFSALWAVEGLGHYYTNLYWDQKGVPRGLLLETAAPVPSQSLFMLHAGMGLAFASRLLDAVPLDAPTGKHIGEVLNQFLSLCRDNARSGYLGAAIESLGLVTRDFFPDLLNIVHRHLAAVAPEMVGYFWHGAGRALYFSREYFVPILGTVWSGIAEETRNWADQQSAMAGLSWAITLVNMRQPAIMESMLRSQSGSRLANAFTNGVVSAVIMREDTTPGEPFTAAFYQHVPSENQIGTIWNARIGEPARIGLEEFYPVLEHYGALDQLFRYQNLKVLVDRLQGRYQE